MKFENVSLLMESLGKKLDSFGDTVEVWIMSPFKTLVSYPQTYYARMSKSA